MVELPNHETDRSGLAKISPRLRQWFERDLNETRPLSLIFAVIPLLPAIIAQELGLNSVVTSAFWMVGSPLAIGWFLYVLWRNTAYAFRDIRQSYKDKEAEQRGEDLPTRCPECSYELPAYQAPNDGKSYNFQGWDCTNCGTQLDRFGRLV